MIQLDEFAFEFSSSRSIKYEFFKENEKARQLDIVTQAYNRGYLYSVLQWEISRRKQSQPSTSRRKKGAVNGLVSMCVIMLDVDHFGEFNKKYDHLIGDQVLRGVVERMKARVRHTDIVARWGGEEFAAFLPDTDKEEAINIAEQILQQIGNHPFIIDTKSLSVTVSLGVAHYEPGMDVDGFMRAADQKMLKAKETGRNKVVS